MGFACATIDAMRVLRAGECNLSLYSIIGILHESHLIMLCTDDTETRTRERKEAEQIERARRKEGAKV